MYQITVKETGSIDPRFLFFMTMNEGKLEEKSLISVHAKIKNLAAWKDLKDVKTRTEIKDDEEGWLVTAELPVNRFEEISKLEFVASLKMSQKIKPHENK